MALFTRVTRTRSGRSSGASTAQLKDQFIRELTSEANSVLKQLSQQFSQDLQSQTSQLLQGFGGDGDGSFGDTAKLLATGARYLISKPKTTQSTTESDRSQEITARFKLSQSQALAEANQTIAKGDKNL